MDGQRLGRTPDGGHESVAELSGGLPSPPGTDKGPDWYPFGTNPNDQAYWDGRNWTARRRWKGAAWEQFPFAVGDGGPDPATAGHSSGSTSWSPVGASRPPRPAAVGAAGPLVLVLGGVGMIIGSVTAWYSVSFSILNRTVQSGTLSGTAHGGEGWISLVGGAVLIIVGLVMLVSDGVALRVMGQVAAASAGAGVAIAIYAMDRIASAYATDTNIGWGLILVLLASLAACAGATFVSLA